MSAIGKVFGGFLGFVFGGGPFGAALGAAVGHAADEGALRGLSLSALRRQAPLGPLRLAAMLGQKDQVFSIAVISLSAKVARADGPVNRAEIDAFKQMFAVPPAALRDVGKLFDTAREAPQDFAPYAEALAESFADHAGVREDVLSSLFRIARADGPVNAAEMDMLARISTALNLDRAAWTRARDGLARGGSEEGDPYAVLGLARNATDQEVRAAWKRLMREHHPDSLASRGVPAEFIARAHEKVAVINAAWDRIKRDRGL